MGSALPRNILTWPACANKHYSSLGQGRSHCWKLTTIKGTELVGNHHLDLQLEGIGLQYNTSLLS